LGGQHHEPDRRPSEQSVRRESDERAGQRRLCRRRSDRSIYGDRRHLVGQVACHGAMAIPEHNERATAATRAPEGGERLLTRRLNTPDGCRQPISVGHQHAKSSSSISRAQARRCQDIVYHDHVARPQCRQLCKCRDRRQKAPRKKPSLSPHRFWHHCGDGCAFGAGSQ
jgi:hypothetical protein